jgi:hypothetical protein
MVGSGRDFQRLQEDRFFRKGLLGDRLGSAARSPWPRDVPPYYSMRYLGRKAARIL